MTDRVNEWMGFHFLSPLTMGSHLDILMGSRFPASLPPAHQELSFALGLPSCIDRFAISLLFPCAYVISFHSFFEGIF